MDTNELERLIDAAVKAERERCARICEARDKQWVEEGMSAYDTERAMEARACAREIRSAK